MLAVDRTASGRVSIAILKVASDICMVSCHEMCNSIGLLEISDRLCSSQSTGRNRAHRHLFRHLLLLYQVESHDCCYKGVQETEMLIRRRETVE
jgi:hypothetical protein